MEHNVGYTILQVMGTIVVILLLQLLIRTRIGRVVHRTVRGHKYATKLDEEKRERTLITIFHTASAVVLWTIGVVLILWQLHINIAALMTGAGLVGIVVGFGAQSAIKDFLAGIFIIAENQYRVGDIVTLHANSKDVSGIVEDITVRITRLRDLDGNLHIVQNGASTVVTNLSFEYANVNIDVKVAYGSSIDKVEQVMNEVGVALAKDEKWAKHIVEPITFLRVDGLEDSGIRVKALGTVEPAMQWDIAGEFRRRILKAFKEHTISIPYPQLTIHKS
jgi:small-conductance mechanosensitive channel